MDKDKQIGKLYGQVLALREQVREHVARERKLDRRNCALEGENADLEIRLSRVCNDRDDVRGDVDRLRTLNQQLQQELRAYRGGTGLPALNDAEKALVAKGHRIPAIQAYRERVGCGLADARNVVVDYCNTLPTPALVGVK